MKAGHPHAKPARKQVCGPYCSSWKHQPHPDLSTSAKLLKTYPADRHTEAGEMRRRMPVGKPGSRTQPQTFKGAGMDEFTSCDACGQRAYVHVVIDVDDLPLSFCSHHFTVNAEALMAYTVRTVDMRHLLHEGAR